MNSFAKPLQLALLGMTVLGLAPLASGQVTVFGEPVSQVRRRIGYVPQRESVDWEFPVNVLDVVLMGVYGRLGWFRRPSAADRCGNPDGGMLSPPGPSTR